MLATTNFTYIICLIPKVSNYEIVIEFHSIFFMCYTRYKIVTTIMANQIKNNIHISFYEMVHITNKITRKMSYFVIEVGIVRAVD